MGLHGLQFGWKPVLHILKDTDRNISIINLKLKFLSHDKGKVYIYVILYVRNGRPVCAESCILHELP